MNAEHDGDTGHDDGDRRERPAAETAVRITAHALDQLAGGEREEIERLLADPAATAARLQFAETRQIATVLREARHDETAARSPALRRAVLAAAVRPGDVAVEPRPAGLRGDARGGGRSRAWIAAAAGLAVSLVAVLAWRSGDLVAPRQVAVRTPAAGLGDRRELDAPADARPMGDPVASMKQADGRESDRLARARPAPARAAAPEAVAPAPVAPTVTSESLASPAPDGPAHQPAERKAAARDESSMAEQQQLRRDATRDGVWSVTASSDADAGAIAGQGPFAAGAAGAAGRVAGEGVGRGAGGAAGIAPSREAYARLQENRAASVAQQPLSTFSIDVDTASYANVRRFLTAGRLPPPEAVRIEELVNYFRYDYPQPAGDAPLAVALEAAECPWHPGRRLVRIGLQGRDLDRRERPAGNLVFLVDVSGSMGDADKLPLVKQALAMLVEELGEHDRVAIVTYAGDAGLRLPGTSGDQKQRILAAIDGLSAGGSTHGSAGIRLAYEQARAHFIRGGVNRVILATDGDLNVGVTDTAALVDLVREQAAGGTFLTVLGVGGGNLQDDKLEGIADHGNGVYAYLDGVREARKVLVEQLTGSTITIAKDVKIQVEFNPAVVESYRLVGYENRVLAARDFRDDRKDAGDVGAGHSVTALYEVSLVDEAGGAAGGEPLRYQPEVAPRPAAPAGVGRELLTVKLRWKRPDGDTSTLLEVPLADRGGAFDGASAELRFAAAVAAFGMVLRGSEERGGATLDLAARIAGAALGSDPGGYRAEFLDLVRRARSLRGE